MLTQLQCYINTEWGKCLSKLLFNWRHSTGLRAEPWQPGKSPPWHGTKPSIAASLSIKELTRTPRTAILTTAWPQWDPSTVLTSTLVSPYTLLQLFLIFTSEQDEWESEVLSLGLSDHSTVNVKIIFVVTYELSIDWQHSFSAYAITW